MSRHKPPQLVTPQRRSQAERAVQMRARLLDATIECLSTSGYGRMSTNDVVGKARVSRGALAHHFPTKADLVTAAAQRLLDDRAEEFRERFGAIAPQRRTPAEALSVLWSFYDDPGALALIELSVAARTHPELKPILGRMGERMEQITAEVVVEFFPELASMPFVEESLRAIHALYAGLVLSSMSGEAAVDHGAEVRAFLKILVSRLDQIDLLGLPATTARNPHPTRTRPTLVRPTTTGSRR